MLHQIPTDLLELTLKEFQNVLIRNKTEYAHLEPSKYGYVQHTSWTDNTGSLGVGIEAWLISPSLIRSVPIKEPTSKFDNNRMFFDTLIGWFYFSPDLTAVIINWQAGPRFGRGFRHRIGQDIHGKYLIDRGTELWIS